MRLGLALAVIAAPLAAAANPPRYDVEAHCDEIAGFGGTYSHDMFAFCIQSEQAAYDGLKPVWDGLPTTIQRHCDQIATFGTPGSYDMLAFCVQDEVSAAGNRPSFDY